MDWQTIWIISIIVSTVIGSTKGEGGLGFVCGLIFGPLGIVFAALSSGNRWPCPRCAEKILKAAKI